MKNSLSRNDICSCGSGKKYKKCCLAKNTGSAQVMDFSWRKLRQLEGEIMDRHLIPYIVEYLPDDVIETALFDFLPDGLPKAMDKELLFTNFLLPLFIFNWIPDDDFGVNDFISTEPIALNYIRNYPEKLNSVQKKFVETMCTTHYSFYVVLEVIPNQALVVRDILLETAHTIKERQGTHFLNRGDILFSRILTLDNQSIFVGMAPYIVPYRYHNDLIEFRKELMEDCQCNLTIDLLRNEFDMCIFDYFFSIMIASFNQPSPKLQNTDGDPMQFCKSFFKLELPIEETFHKLLPLTLSANPEEFLSGAQRDKLGLITKIEFSWLKKGNKHNNNGWGNTVLGHVTIEEKRIVVETNSENRAKAIDKLLTKYLKDKIHFQKTLIESAEQKVKNSKKFKKNEVPLENSPEMEEYLEQYSKRHWENWFDQIIPSLSDKTPREAAKTREGREQLEALLLHYERASQEHPKNSLKIDIPYLRKELGLDN